MIFFNISCGYDQIRADPKNNYTPHTKMRERYMQWRQKKILLLPILSERGIIDAEVAELVDALDSKSSVCKDVRVRVPPSVL